MKDYNYWIGYLKFIQDINDMPYFAIQIDANPNSQFNVTFIPESEAAENLTDLFDKMFLNKKFTFIQAIKQIEKFTKKIQKFKAFI